MITAWKVSKYGVISGPYLPVFGLNSEIFISLNLKTNVICQSSLTLRTSLLERGFSVDKNSNVTDLIDLTDLILIILILMI